MCASTHCFTAPLLEGGLISVDVGIDQFRHDVFAQLLQEAFLREAGIHLFDPLGHLCRLRLVKPPSDRARDRSRHDDERVVGFLVSVRPLRHRFGDGLGQFGLFRLLVRGSVKSDRLSGSAVRAENVSSRPFGRETPIDSLGILLSL